MAKPLTVTQQDILKGKVIKPGWYPAVFKKVDDVSAKSTGVSGWLCTFVVTDGPYKDVPVETRFWENAPGFAAPLIAVLKDSSEAAPGNYDLSNGVGKTMMIYIQNRSYNNRLSNEISDFKPLGK